MGGARTLSRLLLALSVLMAMVGTHPGGVRASSQAKWFWVATGGTWARIQFQPIAVGHQSEVYAPQSVHITRAAARAISSSFEDHILPTDIRLFGLPAHLGKIAIVLAPLPGSTLGYFDENDLLPSHDPNYDPTHSNHGNILYVRAVGTIQSQTQIIALNEAIAHELQHLINYRIRVMDRRYRAEDLWLNEGLSFYAQIANGYLTPSDLGKVRAAASAPSWPVTYMRGTIDFLRQHARVAYGRAGLFICYLASRFGDAFVRALVSVRYTGLRAVDAVLLSLSPQHTLQQVFADWGVAADVGRAGIYGYGQLPSALHEMPALMIPAVSAYPFDSARSATALSLQPWSHGYLRFLPGRANDVRLAVTSTPGHVSVAAILRDTDGAVPTKIHWLQFGPDGRASYRISEFGGFYNRLDVVMSDTGPLETRTVPPRDPIRVSAVLIHVRDNY